MNYITPTFHFQQGDELCFQTSIPQQQQQQQILQEMFSAGPPVTLTDDRQHPSFKLHTVPRRKPVAPPAGQAAGADGDEDSHTSKKKKIIHRDVERQRRHEMAMLYASLRSLLPLEYLKGKRSISDHMNEAANYIKHQQKKIEELKDKRDGLRRMALSSSSSGSLHGNGSSASVAVRPCWVGVEAVISSGLYDGVPLAKVLAALIAEALDVVSCVSTHVNEGFIYTIQCEVTGELKDINFSRLEQKLTDLILPGWDSRVCGTSSRGEEEVCLN